MEILYIEDDLIDQMVFKRLIRKQENLRGVVASSLDEAMEQLQIQNFDIVLSDYYLGGSTVIEVLEHIHTAPIYLVSGLEDTHQIKALYNKGLKGHFSKPLNKTALSSLLNNKTVISSSHLAPEKLADFSKPIQFNWTQLEKIAPLSLDRKIEFVKILVSLSERILPQLTIAVQNKDIAHIQYIAHTLKSTLNMVGFLELRRKANEIEKACNEPENFSEILVEVECFIKRLKAGIIVAENYLKTHYA